MPCGSLPSRERGLKLHCYVLSQLCYNVAPFAGAWIEITGEDDIVQRFKSLPSRERGLKSPSLHVLFSDLPVAPFAGAWIEIKMPPL